MTFEIFFKIRHDAFELSNEQHITLIQFLLIDFLILPFVIDLQICFIPTVFVKELVLT
jgi:hypothetical protein